MLTRRINEEFKDKLLAAGKWGEFLELRERLRAEGARPSDARRQALNHFAEFLPSYSVVPDKVTKPKREKKVRGLSVPVEEAAVVSVAPVVAGVRLPGPVPITKGAFEGRECSLADSILWVMRYMDVVDVTPEECPDLAAWTMMNTARSSAMGRIEFIRSMAAKIIVKPKDDGDEGDGQIDGAVQIETIDKILSASKRCGVEQSEARRAHNSEVASSSLAPATNLVGVA